MMTMDIRDTPRRINLHNIDEEPRHELEHMGDQCIIKNIIEWDGLGNSKNRTAEQAQRAVRVTSEFIQEIEDGVAIAFTDGSALGNPGPCGAGAVIYLDGIDSQPVLLRRPVSRRSTSYHGELQAIELAIDFLCNCTKRYTGLCILTDCQSALTTVTGMNQYNEHTSLVQEIARKSKILDDRGTPCAITWIAGHAGLNGNELADDCAKEAALETRDWTDVQLSAPLTFREVKQEIHSDIEARWQQQWNIESKGRSLHEIQPAVTTKNYVSTTDFPIEKTLNRLKTGHSLLRNHTWKMKIPGVDGPECRCGQNAETRSHIMLDCPLLSIQWDNLLDKIEQAFNAYGTALQDREITLITLIGRTEHLSKELGQEIQEAVQEFLLAIPSRI